MIKQLEEEETAREASGNIQLLPLCEEMAFVQSKRQRGTGWAIFSRGQLAVFNGKWASVIYTWAI